MNQQQQSSPDVSGLTFEKVWAMFQETDKKLNKHERLFTGQWGKLVESLVEGDLVRLLKKRGIDIEETYERRKRIYKGKMIEIDIVAANGKDVIPVEVKTTMKVEDVNYFLDKLNIFKKAFPEYKSRKVYGSIAYIKVEEAADKYAYRQGLFVIRATGKSATITNDKKFKPKSF